MTERKRMGVRSAHPLFQNRSCTCPAMSIKKKTPSSALVTSHQILFMSYQLGSDCSLRFSRPLNFSFSHAFMRTIDAKLPIWYTTLYVQRGDDSMFRALSLLEDGTTDHHGHWREKIVEYVANHLMKDTRYHGKDCQVLTTTVGCNMNMVPILLNKKVCRISSLTLSDLSIIMDFLSETPEAYRKRMLGRRHNRGSYLELVAIGKILERHVVVFYPSGTSIRINHGGVEDLEQNTLYDGRFHRLEMLPLRIVVEDEPPHMETRQAKRIRLGL